MNSPSERIRRPRRFSLRHYLPDAAGRRNFRTLYISSFLIDLGLCLYFFLFSLFLVEHHFPEQSIGYITAALTIGTLAGTLPASLLSRRFGLQTMMMVYVTAVPFLLASRTFFLQMPTQITLGFLAGAAMSLWSVCFSPTLAKLTNNKNRTLGFSVFVATGIGSGIFAGLAGGYLPGFLSQHAPNDDQIDGIRVVLLLACVIISLAATALLGLRMEKTAQIKSAGPGTFLLRYLVAAGVWSFALNFFNPFANVYLSRYQHLPLARIGSIYSISQVIQVITVLLAPLLYSRIGLVKGIALTQLGTGTLLLWLAHAHTPSGAVVIFIALNSVQWISGPGMSALLMGRTLERSRSHAVAMQTIVNLGAQASSTALAGRFFQRYGYIIPLKADATIAALAGLLLYLLLRQKHGEADAQPMLNQLPQELPAS
jgi:MFS family permease